MKVFKNLKEWQAYRAELNGAVGFVPTMGNLHAGHASLLQRSITENNQTILSIYVNPTQFNNPEDLKNYPRTMTEDLLLAETLGVHAVLLPNYEDLYADAYRYQIQETVLSLKQEGQYRPGHFTGVLTVVMKLLNIVQATRAYFGEKDYQQLQLIRGMVKAFFMPVEIVGCPIVRDEEGLALSSRNSRLNEEQLSQARAFAKVLSNTVDINVVKAQLEQLGITVDYIEDSDRRRFAAVYVGNIRLIDNIEIIRS